MPEHVFEVGQPIIYINDFGRPEFVTVAHPPRPLATGQTVLPINGRTGLPPERNGYDIVTIERCHPYPALTAHPPATWGDVQGLSFRDALRSQMIVALGEQLTEKEAEIERLTAERDALLWFLERAGEALDSVGRGELDLGLDRSAPLREMNPPGRVDNGWQVG